MDMDKYLNMFIDESKEHLQSLNDCLLKLENDSSNVSIVNELFRNAHTIKGMSATMGFSKIADLTHAMENVLDLLRKNKLQCTTEIIDILFKCVDTLAIMIENAPTSENDTDISSLLVLLKNISSNEEDTDNSNTIEDSGVLYKLTTEEEDIIKKAKKDGLNVFDISVVLSADSIFKAVRVFIVLKTLGELGNVLKYSPVRKEIEKEKFDGRFFLVFITNQKEDVIKNIILKIMDVYSVNISIYTEPIVEQASAGSNFIKKSNFIKSKPVQSIRVGSDKLDSLLNFVGEIVINKTRLQQICLNIKSPDLIETTEQLNLIAHELQALVMEIRMVPISQAFNLFPRMIRDLSHELGKEIEFFISGEDTELDRIIIDEIGEPLVHLLRNAVDHGIETPAERGELGKKPIGKIRLTATHDGSNVVISIEDDGRGMDLEVIKKKAIEKGLININEASNMGTDEILSLIFLPGFSTTKVVSDVSGRGVGMDIVRNKIESLGGSVEIDTKLNFGSKFKIKLPLTLEIVQALIVKISSEVYALPLDFIESIMSVQQSEISIKNNKEVCLFRNKLVPLIRLSKILSVSYTPNLPLNGDEYVIIVKVGDKKGGFIVDYLVGQQDIVIKSLSSLISDIDIISGATVLGDGSIVLILDVGALIQNEYI